MTLSDKINHSLLGDQSNDATLKVNEVKEFIQKLKEELRYLADKDWDMDYNEVIEEIDKLAGAALTNHDGRRPSPLESQEAKDEYDALIHSPRTYPKYKVVEDTPEDSIVSAKKSSGTHGSGNVSCAKCKTCGHPIEEIVYPETTDKTDCTNPNIPSVISKRSAEGKCSHGYNKGVHKGCDNQKCANLKEILLKLKDDLIECNLCGHCQRQIFEEIDRIEVGK